MRLTAFVRLLRILHIFTRYRLDQILLDLPLPLLGRLLLFGSLYLRLGVFRVFFLLTHC